MKLTKTQRERVKKVKSYLAEVGRVHFKSNSKSRERLDMNQGQLRDTVIILVKLGILMRYTNSTSNYTYEVKLDLL